jgi:hypothetical protein
VLALAAGAGGCGGGDEQAAPEPKIEGAVPFMNSFVRRMVVGGRWEEIDPDVAPEISPEMKKLQRTLVRDGVRRVKGPGKVRRDCPENVFIGAGNECLLYELEGRESKPVAGTMRIVGMLRLWVDRFEGSWEVTNFTYDARVT